MKRLNTLIISSPQIRICGVLIIILLLFSACGKKEVTTVKPTELQKLRTRMSAGIHAGLNAKLGIFYIGNELVERWIAYHKEPKGISTVKFVDYRAAKDYVSEPSGEFHFRIGNVIFSGNNGKLSYLSHKVQNIPYGVKRLSIILQYKDTPERVTFLVSVNYEIYPRCSAIRKWLEFENKSGSPLIIEDLQVEKIALTKTGEFYGYNPERNLSLPFSGGANEPIVCSFQSEKGEGFILGNEAPGLLKYYSLYEAENTISIGLPPKGDKWATEIRIPAGESASTPKTFILLFKGDDINTAFKSELGKFIQQYTKVSVTEREGRLQDVAPTSRYVYFMDMSADSKETEKTPGEEVKLVCVDYDFQKPIPEDYRVKDKTEEEQRAFRLSAKRIETNADDSLRTEEEKSETNGNKEIIEQLIFLRDSLRKAKMKFGIRVNLATVGEDSEIANNLAWAVKKSDGTYWSTEVKGERAKIFCLASEYGDYVTSKLDEVVGGLGVDYIIFDMCAVGSAEESAYGCSAYGHKHFTRAESLWMLYKRIFEIADFLHQQYPNLVICATPTFYGAQIPDIVLLGHFDQFLLNPGEINDLMDFLPNETILVDWKMDN